MGSMSATAIQLPRVSMNGDLVEAFASFHEAIRDVAAWLPAVVDDEGAANPRDARWLRAFLTGPLAWHIADEESVLVPRLALRQGSWLDVCLARACQKHSAVAAHAAELTALLEPLCAGDPVAPARWVRAVRRFVDAVEDDLRYEDDILLPSAQVFLDASERACIAREIANRDEARPWLAVATAGATPVTRRVHAVRARKRTGLDVVRSFADCPRRRAAAVDACASCRHLEALDVDGDGRGQVACAIDAAPARAEARVGDVMTRDVICVERDTPLAELVHMLAQSCVTGMPVVDDLGRALGVVSQSDIIDAVAEGRDVDGLVVGDVMMHAPIVVREDDRLADAARLLVIEGIHRLPVINSERIVVGIVSTLDLLRATVGRSRSSSA